MAGHLKKERVGMVFTHRKFGEYEVVEYLTHSDIKVRFKNTGSIVHTQYGHAKRGIVRDPQAPSVLGVGISGGAAGYEDGKELKSYKTWAKMIGRCYSDKIQKRQPTYIGCTVSDEWKHYVKFKVWFDDNYEEGLVLDKDILVEGNKVYSESTCKLVTPYENTLAANRHKMYKVVVSNAEGQEFLVANQATFCRDMGIEQRNFNAMVRGRIKTSEGYKLVHRVNSEEEGLNKVEEVL